MFYYDIFLNLNCSLLLIFYYYGLIYPLRLHKNHLRLLINTPYDVELFLNLSSLRIINHSSVLKNSHLLNFLLFKRNYKKFLGLELKYMFKILHFLPLSKGCIGIFELMMFHLYLLKLHSLNLLWLR